MASKRLLVLVTAPPAGQTGGNTGPLGRAKEIREKLAPFNTAPDGSARKSVGTEILFGPGILVELPTGQDEINQALVTMIEEEIAWPVLMRMCRTLGWALMDPNTGRTFGTQGER